MSGLVRLYCIGSNTLAALTASTQSPCPDQQRRNAVSSARGGSRRRLCRCSAVRTPSYAAAWPRTMPQWARQVRISTPFLSCCTLQRHRRAFGLARAGRCHNPHNIALMQMQAKRPNQQLGLTAARTARQHV